jgi:hypothetical protein
MAEGVTVSGAVPCGSVGETRVISATRVEIGVQSSIEFGIEGALETWVCGQIEGHHQPVEVFVPNEHGNMQFLRPVARRPDADWQHVAEYHRRDDGYRFVVPAAGGAAVDFATWWPYGEAEHAALLDELAASPFVSLEPIGTTVHGRTITGLVISDGAGPTLAVVSGFHGGEPSALWATDSMLRFAASPGGAELRRQGRIAAVPLLNVDAVAEGLDRRSAGGINLWLDRDAQSAPEVVALDGFVLANKPAAVLDVHSWHWNSDGCYTPGWLATGDELYNRILDLRDAIDRRFPLGGQLFFSDDLDCWLTRISAELGVPAIDVEVTMARGSDGEWKTLDRARQDGVSILTAAIDHVASGR